LGSFFVGGALLYYFRDRVPISGVLAASSLLVSVALVIAGAFHVLGALPFAYLLLWCGTVLPLRRVGARNDISYGMYIYAFPLQQLLAIGLGPRPLPVLVYVVVSVALAVPFAAASWFVVEKPALRLKRLTMRRRTSETVAGPDAQES
jgi:peptidoglycan/LPS O-acetylase OafA/YrhL